MSTASEAIARPTLFLPGLDWGALGGWTATVVYSLVMGVLLHLRRRFGAWRRIVLR
jgi:hypothetical protein